ncbi:extracellular solute-binding protein [Lederbergia sp. NSJ-179]|uniref:ABC transporter substrate-binding protein n=1 Tax=Lederbergia sp. NSJ-179 TaxID=2931402 RepID=UPI001FD2476D|nr:extracellular solute-binding protein [Lederbergia sp. NSJ-179]MCJ7842464.1 extracellular solute-binding protein [Lederbergia sp. NSJ-179]
MKGCKKLFYGFAILLVLLLISCSNSNQKTDTEPKKSGSSEEGEHEPITLKAVALWDENMFNERFKEPIEKEFPYMTVEHVPGNNFDRKSLEEEVFGNGENPDFFFTLSQQDMEYFELDQDLTDLLEANQIDTSHLNQALLDTIRARDKEGRLLAWPYEDTYYVIMYNKDIFDLFGESYPRDDMTWDELIELAGRLTQERDGTYYRGLDFQDEVALSQFSVNKTDPETGEVLITKQDEFSKYLNLYKRYFETVPLGENEEEGFFTDHRFNDQRTAMVVTNAQAIAWRNESGLNYDLAAIPTWPDRPGVAPRGFLHTLTLNPASEHVDDVLKIFAYFSSDEYQQYMAKKGIGIVSNKKELQEGFYSDYESAEGKNIEAIFKNETAPPPERISPWDQYVDINLQKFYESGMDANEFLRIVTEESEAKILEAKNQE